MTICEIIRDFPEPSHQRQRSARWLSGGAGNESGSDVWKLRFSNEVGPEPESDDFPTSRAMRFSTGLHSGRSLGQTLQDLGLNEREAKEARKRADAEIKAARKNN